MLRFSNPVLTTKLALLSALLLLPVVHAFSTTRAFSRSASTLAATKMQVAASKIQMGSAAVSPVEGRSKRRSRTPNQAPRKSKSAGLSAALAQKSKRRSDKVMGQSPEAVLHPLQYDMQSHDADYDDLMSALRPEGDVAKKNPAEPFDIDMTLQLFSRELRELEHALKI